MSPQTGPRDAWAVPIVLLWCLFFAAGLDPEATFQFLRGAGRVVSQRALVNSPHVITLSLAGFLTAHVYLRCREAGLSKVDAQARALQTGVLALAAFLRFSIQSFFAAADLPVLEQRLLVVSVGLVKYTVWIYLVFTIARFHLFGRVSAFTGMVSVFPSTYTDGSGNGKSTGLDRDRVATNVPQPEQSASASQSAAEPPQSRSN